MGGGKRRLVAISRGEEGNILSLEQNTAAMAQVQGFVSNFVQEKLSGTGGTVWVPVGSLTGISLLYGCGAGYPSFRHHGGVMPGFV